MKGFKDSLYLAAMVIVAVLLVAGVRAVFGAQPGLSAEPVADTVDLVEVNHFFDERGRKVFDQVIFYDLRPGQYEVEGGFYDTTTEFQNEWVHLENGEHAVHSRPKTALVSRPETVRRDYRVRAWRIIKHPNQLPHRDYERGGYVAVWHDGEVLRVVRSGEYRETWTQYDPELIERAYLPKEGRRELTKVDVPLPPPVRPPPADVEVGPEGPP